MKRRHRKDLRSMKNYDLWRKIGNLPSDSFILNAVFSDLLKQLLMN